MASSTGRACWTKLQPVYPPAFRRQGRIFLRASRIESANGWQRPLSDVPVTDQAQFLSLAAQPLFSSARRMTQPIVDTAGQQIRDLKQIVRLGIQRLDLLQYAPWSKFVPGRHAQVHLLIDASISKLSLDLIFVISRMDNAFNMLRKLRQKLGFALLTEEFPLIKFHEVERIAYAWTFQRRCQIPTGAVCPLRVCLPNV